MYCRNCNVTVDCETEVCPLCHEKIERDGKTPKENLPSPKGSVKKQRLDIFSKIYIPTALLTVLACISVNVLTNPDFMWSVMVLAAVVYIYYLVRFTFIAQGNFPARIFGQVIALTIVFIAVRLIFGGNHWIFITWLPIVYFLSELMIGVYSIVKRKTACSHLSRFLLLTFLGIIPVCAAFILNLSVKWPSVAVSAFSFALMIVLAIIERKQIIAEIKHYFHI